MYNLTPEGHTNLDVDGSIVFGGTVADLILERKTLLEFDHYVAVDPKLSYAVEEGEYYKSLMRYHSSLRIREYWR